MTIKRRTWTTSRGEQREAWVVRYRDQAGTWRLKTFARQREAKDWAATAAHEVKQGVHRPESTSPTVAAACGAWVKRGEADGRERSTLVQRRQHVELHILPLLGANTKLSRIDCEAFRDELLRTRSRAMAAKVMTSLRSILKQAKMAHLAADVEQIKTGGRHKKRPEVGRDIPEPDEVRALLAQASGYIRGALAVMVFCGLRMSEVRALRWQDVDLDERVLHVRQRADKWQQIGPLKTETSYRTVPLSPFVLNTLKEWRLARQGDGLVFGTGTGKPESLPNIWNRHLAPLQVASGVVGADGKAKYGAHAFRHFCASWWLQEMRFNVKRVSVLLGHASPMVTLTVYSHLLPSEDEHAKFAAGEVALVS